MKAFKKFLKEYLKDFSSYERAKNTIDKEIYSTRDVKKIIELKKMDNELDEEALSQALESYRINSIEAFKENLIKELAEQKVLGNPNIVRIIRNYNG